MTLAIHWATRPCRGESENGDGIFVRQTPTRTTFAVIDALGHGPIAAIASKAATRFLEESRGSCSAVELIHGLHAALRGTRGAGAMVGVFEHGSFEAAGVGNVALRVFGSRFEVAPSPGIIGSRIRDVRATVARLTAGTRIIAFTDGIDPRTDFRTWLETRGPDACDRILRQSSIPHDDATVLVADLEVP